MIRAGRSSRVGNGGEVRSEQRLNFSALNVGELCNRVFFLAIFSTESVDKSVGNLFNHAMSAVNNRNVTN